MNPKIIKQMRDWLADCTWADLEPEDVDGLSEAQVIAGVKAHFDGGIEEFLATCEPVTVHEELFPTKMSVTEFDTALYTVRAMLGEMMIYAAKQRLTQVGVSVSAAFDSMNDAVKKHEQMPTRN
jgi:hypothetical protein